MVVIMVLSVAVSVRRKNIKKKRALRRFLETEVRRKHIKNMSQEGMRLVPVALEDNGARKTVTDWKPGDSFHMPHFFSTKKSFKSLFFPFTCHVYIYIYI